GEVFFRINQPEESKQLMASARDHYWNAFRADRAFHWAVVQYLSLTLIIRNSVQFPDKESYSAKPELQPEQEPKTLWTVARALSLYDLHHASVETRSWAHGNLIELYLLSVLPEIQTFERDEAQRRALQLADQLIEIAGRYSFEVFSTRRQMLRY